MLFKKILKKYLPKSAIEMVTKVKNDYFDGYALKSYSQEGEDILGVFQIHISFIKKVGVVSI